MVPSSQGQGQGQMISPPPGDQMYPGSMSMNGGDTYQHISSMGANQVSSLILFWESLVYNGQNNQQSFRILNVCDVIVGRKYF